MDVLIITREGFQVSQKALSEYLLVSESLLKMAETDRRMLPGKKMQELWELHNYLEPLKPLEALSTVALYQQDEAQALQPWIKEQITVLRFRQRKLKEKLAKQQLAYQKYLRVLDAFTKAKAQMAHQTQHQQSWLKLYARETAERLEKNGRKAQIQVEIKLDKIKQELEVLEGYLDGNK